MPSALSLRDLTTSGDMMTDRRLAYALDMAARGDQEASLDLLEQAIARTPAWPPLYFHKASLLSAMSRADESAQAYRDYLQHDPDDHMGAQIKLALLGAIALPDSFGETYVRALFDQYAPRFDHALLNALHYIVPHRLHAMITAFRPSTGKCERILDLGCGTGLMGEYVAPRATYLTGVDLSSAMIAQAAAKHTYDRLETADITAFLATTPDQPYDLIIAADVFTYIGALDRLIPLIAAHLTPGGLTAFSVQSIAGIEYALGADHRFSHSLPYLTRLLTASGLSVRDCHEETLRTDGALDVRGYLIIAEKAA